MNRRILQDWDVWLSKADHNGNDVNLHLENIYLDLLQEDDNFLYNSLQVGSHILIAVRIHVRLDRVH